MNTLHADALQEVANIGAGHAATVLSQMTNWQVLIDVPRVSLGSDHSLDDAFPADGDGIVAVWTHMYGDLRGRTAFALGLADARRLAGALMGALERQGSGLGEMERSGLLELGNVMTASFMNALAEVMRCTLLPSTPNLNEGSPSDVQAAFTEDGSTDLLVVETRFRFHGNEGAYPPPVDSIGGMMVFAVEPATVHQILSALIPQ